MNYIIPRPEGFIVDEIPNVYGSGDCTHFTLKKTGWNTRDVINIIAKKLHVPPERFGYAGLKDRNAVTTQRISAWRIPIARLEALNIKGIELSDFREGLERIKLGTHLGNHFRITLEGVKIKDLKTPVNIPNYFGPQRFGGNELLGKALLDRDWKGCADLLIEGRGRTEEEARNYLNKNPENYLGLLKRIDKGLRLLWINALQSIEWNSKVRELLKNQTCIRSLPLQSYPAIPEMPELGEFPGGERELLMNVKDYKVTETEEGVVLEFLLPKGSYATTLIDYLTNNHNEL